MHEHISLQNCDLIKFTPQYGDFIKSLFTQADIRKFYVLRADHARNIDQFIKYIYNGCNGLNYLIVNNSKQLVGFISAELLQDNRNGQPYWNVGYAVDQQFRGYGYASDALDGLSQYLLSNFSIQNIVLDISEDNEASQRVAEKCGFKKKEFDEYGQRVASIDMEHMELGIRYKWTRSLSGKRIAYFNQATQAYRMKDYSTALSLYKKALEEEYPAGTPFTDAQIYSNMGMTYSSLHMYKEDYECLKKAQSLGLNNPSIEKELAWLRNNVGLY